MKEELQKNWNVVPGTSNDLSGGSIRTGAIEHMCSRGVFPNSILAVTGHDMTGFSAMCEFILTSAAAAIPGVKALAGWMAGRLPNIDDTCHTVFYCIAFDHNCSML